MVIRGGVGLFFDRPDGDSIYYQSQNPPTSTNQTVRNGMLQSLGTGTGAASSGVPTLINYRYDNPHLPSSLAVEHRRADGAALVVVARRRLRRAALLPRAERVPVADGGEHQRD